MFEAVKEKMQIAPQEISDYMVVVPVPDHIARSCLNSFSPNIAGNAKFRQVGIMNVVFLQKSSKVTLAQFGAIHTHSVLTNVHQCANAVGLEHFNNFLGLSPGISEGEEICCRCGSTIVPKTFAFNLSFNGGARKIQPIGLWHIHSLAEFPLDDTVSIFVPLQTNVLLKTMNPLIIRELLR